MFFILQRFLGHFTNHMGQKRSRNCRKSTKNGVGRHHFRALFGPIGALTWAHLGPNCAIWSHHMVHCGTGWKKLLEMLKSGVFQKRTKIGPKNLYSQLSQLFISVVDFYGFYIFSYNFQPILIKLVAFFSQSDGATFHCSEFWIFISKQNGGHVIQKFVKNKICKLLGGAILFWDKNSKFWTDQL